MAKCRECGCTLRRDDEFQGAEANPVHAACLADADPTKTKVWDLDNGEADDAADTKAAQASEA